MKRFASLIVAAGAVAVTGAFTLAGGASGASTLPTVNVALTGKTGISVSGTPVSGAVNVVSTFTGKGHGQVGLVRLNPVLPPAVAAAEGFGAVQAHHGDLNALTVFGDLVIFNAGAPSTAQTVLSPGAYLALNLTGSGKPAFASFNVAQAPHPAALPTPGGTVKAIDFGFRGAKTLHRGELVRFENDGFLVHMIVASRVKNRADAALETALLRAGKDRKAFRLSRGFANFAGPLSPGGLQQEIIHAKPGIYVLQCFMNTQDGREHTRVGMMRTIRITK